jgi:hypothetical protein
VEADIKVGGKVRWINNDSTVHTITSGLGPSDKEDRKIFASDVVNCSGCQPDFNLIGIPDLKASGCNIRIQIY